MAQIETARSAATWLTWDQVIDRIEAYAPQYRWTVVRIAANRLDVRRGSQAALRLKGAMFTSVEQFPVVAAVVADPAPEGAIVRIRCVDDLGVGTRLGMRGRYGSAVEDLADLVLAICCPDRPAHADIRCPNGHPTAPGARFCPVCGSALGTI